MKILKKLIKKILGNSFFNIGNLFVKQKPELAYGLLAIKNIK